MEPGGTRPDILPHLRLDELLAELLAELQGRLQVVLGARDQMHGLLEAVVAIGSGLDLESTLRRIVQTAVGLVDASYGALGVIGEGSAGGGRVLAEFIPAPQRAAEPGRARRQAGRRVASQRCGSGCGLAGDEAGMAGAVRGLTGPPSRACGPHSSAAFGQGKIPASGWG
jgi:hypothetical protein